MPAQTVETIGEIVRWSDRLVSLRLTRHPDFVFQAGQFARLGRERGGQVVRRAYSMVSASDDSMLEFLLAEVPNGAFTGDLAGLAVGDQLQVSAMPFGFFTLDRFVGGDDLWLLATGTGIAPYISLLRESAVWQRYRNIVLVYSVSLAKDLAYVEHVAALGQAGKGARLHVVSVVTREAVPGALSRRLTDLLMDGELEKILDLPLDAGRSRVMMCGNPQMVKDCLALLQDRGLALSRHNAPAQLAVELYR